MFNLLLSPKVSASPEETRRKFSLLQDPQVAAAGSVPRLRGLLHSGGTVDLINMLTIALHESPFFSFQRAPADLW